MNAPHPTLTRFVAPALATLVLLAACGGDDDASSASSSTTTSVTTFATLATVADTTLPATEPSSPTTDPSSPTSEPESATSTYTIVAGDSLFAIADREGITLDALVAANGWTDGIDHLILPGDEILIPSPSAVTTDGTTTTSGA